MRLNRIIQGSLLAAGIFASHTHAGILQWRVEDGGNGHWYEAVTEYTSISWTAARDAAAARGGHLATLTSASENAWVFSNVASDPSIWFGDGVWLGGYQDLSASDYSEPTGGWRWITGETWSFTNWAQAEPNNGNGSGQHFLQLWDRGQITDKWDDHWVNGTSASRSYLVEYAVPAPSALVLLLGPVLMHRRRAGSNSIPCKARNSI